MSTNPAADLYLRPLPYLDEKWLRADLLSSLRHMSDTAILWNHLIHDCELVSTSAAPILNSAGNLSYLGDDGKHHCGVQKLQCSCCASKYCGPLTACNCNACRTLDSDAAVKKLTAAVQTAAAQKLSSDAIFESWLWDPYPNRQAKSNCQRTLLNELHDITLQAAGNCLSSLHLRQQLFIYERYFVALERCKKRQESQLTSKHSLEQIPNAKQQLNPKPFEVAKCSTANRRLQNSVYSYPKYLMHLSNNRWSGGKSKARSIMANKKMRQNDLAKKNRCICALKLKSTDCAASKHLKAAEILAQVGTRAAVNFSFAFLRRAWRSGEDTELCSALLAEAWEALRELPEASLYNSKEMSDLWLEVLESSMKFLRQVAFGGPNSGRCVAPRRDRNLALCLLLEICVQKGTLPAILEGIVILLSLWSKEGSPDDNRDLPQSLTAQLVPMLKRFEEMSQFALNLTNESAQNIHVTEAFLKLYSIPDSETAYVDVKTAAVFILSHLDRMCLHHMPLNNAPIRNSMSNNKANATSTTPTSNTTITSTKTTNTNNKPLGDNSETPASQENSNSLNPESSASTENTEVLNQPTPTAMKEGPGIPTATLVNATKPQLHEQRIYALGWSSLNNHQYGFTSEPAINLSTPLTSSGGGKNTNYFKYSAPVLNFYFQVKKVAFSEEMILFLTHEGRIYMWNIAKPQAEPMLVDELSDVELLDMAAHCEGRHYLALDCYGLVYAWGNGENGRLGHSDTLPRDQPIMVQGVSNVRSVHCGCSYSAAITHEGMLYTWGRGTYGRLGHGNSDDKLMPTLVWALKEHEVIDVALGSGDSHTLCATSDGLVYAWGDGDFGKLGNGGLNGTQLPIVVETLPRIKRVYVGSQFSLALTHEGRLYTWGKLCGGRLGHPIYQPNQTSVNQPKLLEDLQHKTLVDVSVGVSHCLALSNTGEVYGWGRNDCQQICPSSISLEPILRTPILVTHSTVLAHGISCGAVQSIIWSQTSMQTVPTCLPFVIQPAEKTFRFLDQLFNMVSTSTDTEGRPPIQLDECITVTCLNLLRLQFHALLINDISAASVGLVQGKRLLNNLKKRILTLAGGSKVLKSVQKAAQAALQVGWSILLPTAAERAQTLTSLLPTEPGISSSGHRFMTDLLVSSLMAEGGLETALNQAIRPDNYDQTPTLPLLHLIRQLLRNISTLTQMRLVRLVLRTGAVVKQEIDGCTYTLSMKNKLTQLERLAIFEFNYDNSKEQSNDDMCPTIIELPNPSLDLLHRFQRLLLAHLHQAKPEEVGGAEALLIKYMFSVLTHCTRSVRKAHEVAVRGLEGVTDILKNDISDTLLYELVVGLILLKRDRAHILPSYNWSKFLLPLLRCLDAFNRLICDSDVQDADDMGWPGITSRGGQNLPKSPENEEFMCHADVENHVLEGKKYVILKGYVCDINDYESDIPMVNELLEAGIGKDLSEHFDTPLYCQCLDVIFKNLKVCRLIPGGLEDKLPMHDSKNLTHLNTERALGHLLGLISNLMQSGPPQQAEELQCKNFLEKQLLSGGLQMLQPINPFEEEKTEARSCGSTTVNTPTEPQKNISLLNLKSSLVQHGNNVQQRIDSFVNNLAEARLTDALIVTWMTLTERFYKENNMVLHQQFTIEHPVQELERLMSAALIRHQSLGGLVLNMLERELAGVGVTKPPKAVIEMIRLIYQAKWAVIRQRQLLNRSYKEVCAPMLERLRFLLFEVRPAVSLEQEGLRKLSILHTQTRFKGIVRKIMKDLKAVKKQMQIVKKQDILNVSIQQQQQQQQQQQLEQLQKSQEVCAQNNKNLSHEHLIEANEKQHYMMYGQENEYDYKCEMHLSNNYLQKLSEKWYFCGEVNVPLMNEIVEFVLQDNCDVETVRRAMYCQVQRYQIRLTGLSMFDQLLKLRGLLDAVQYNLLSGYLGLNLKGNLKRPLSYVLNELKFVTAFQKVNLLLAQSHILEWAVHELQRLVNEEQQWRRKGSVDVKHDVNLNAYILVKKIPRARFLLSIFGILARDMGPHELSLLVNSGALGTILGLLRQTGGDLLAAKHHCELSVVYEDILLKQKSNRSNLSGPELAKLMKVGTRIVRGSDWKWGDQDGNPPGEGRIISEVGDDGWVRVEWYTGATNSYRMGKEGQYDLRLADSALNIASPETDIEKEDYSYDAPPTSESAPTKLLRYACTRLLEIIAVGIGLHSEKIDKNAMRGLSSMFRAVLDPNSAISHTNATDNWAILGFLRAIAGDSPNLCKELISSSWIEFYLQLLEQPIEREADVFRKVHCLRLLETVLVHWSDDEERMILLVRQLFSLLGTLSFFCPYDVSLQQCAVNNFPKPPRVLLTCSHSSTVVEEIIGLLRKLHTLPHWNSIINSFLAQKLCVAAELFGEDTSVEAFQELEYIYVMGVLGTIGGYDLRPRIGLQIRHEGTSSKICGFTQHGKALLHVNNPVVTEDQRRISLQVALNTADYSLFSLNRLPLNEMLLNSWAVMLYGPGERKECIPRVIDVGLLRAQQLQLAVLNTNGVLCRYQIALRNILKQRAPLSSMVNVNSPDESLSEGEEEQEDGVIQNSIKNNIKSIELSKVASENDNEQLLVQSILVRATQPSPLKSRYSYKDMAMAALNCTQLLAAQVHAESTASQGRLLQQPPMTATMVHGEPVYNISAYNEATALQAANLKNLADNNNKCTAQLLTQITDMGFARHQVEAAIKQMQLKQQQLPNTEKAVPTPEQVVQCILEQSNSVHDQLSKSVDSENSESLDSSDDTVAGGSCSSLPDAVANSGSIEKYETRKDFQTDDQYAMYVRGLVQPGMVVRCCRDFEEIKKGDIGTVLKVDTEGLHDLNVQVDWQQHGNTYWVCFVHIDLMELPRRGSFSSRIIVGSQVRLRAPPRYKGGFVVRGSIGTVKVVNGKDITVDFAQHSGWQGSLNDVECVSSPAAGNSSIFGQSSQVSSVVQNDLIEDWSRCLRSLSVSSNETTAKYLLDRSPNYWKSASSNHGKHWIRLEMHDNVLVHNLSIVVSAGDQSHMPTLVVTRVGSSISNLKEYNWMSIKSTDTVVPIMNDVRQYFQWIEIVIKQCRNNGIQCKVHGIRVVGRRKQPDLDLMLTNADFLACEYDGIQETSLGTGESTRYNNEPPCTVMVWGLNDKEQLGGLKGSKVKIPTFSQTISRLRPIHISGGSKSLFIVSQDGKVYACGEGTNGRLGLGVTVNVAMPRQVPVLHQYVIKKVAVHSGGKHALALTLDGKVFSWGEGEDGKLGHGNRLTMDKAKIIEALRSKKIRDIACGSSHSAAITSSGELYTWGLGEYGRLGHGDNSTQLKPKLVQALQGKRVIQVACGSRDAQTLALTEDGAVFSWGDGDFGKLGRGGSEGSAIPHEIERLTGIGVIQIECGAQFSLALTRAGEVWTWGKGDYYRLGHGNDTHIRKPQPVQGLRGKKVIHVAVGALHCLAVTDTGQVYAWGDNDHGQQGSGNTAVNKKPALVIGLDSVFVNRVACGSSHSVAWGMPQGTLDDEKKGPLPFNSSKDPLGGCSLGIYDSEPKAICYGGSNNSNQQQEISLSETVLSLETNGARQTALNYVLNAMSILQARQLIVSALTSHSKINIHDSLKNDIDCCIEESTFKEASTDLAGPANSHSEVIAQGGGEALADPVIDPAVHESSPEIEMIPSVVMNNFQSMTGSISLSASLSSNAQQKHSKMSSSAMSVIAATINNQEEFIEETSLTGLDDFTSLLSESEAKSLVELLKLSVAGRTGPPSTVSTIADTLVALGANSPAIGLMLLETCITELEDLCTSRYCLNRTPKSVMQESSHPYVDDSSISGHVKIPGAEALRLEFDCQCSTEKRNDPLVIMDSTGRVVAMRSGREFTQWAPEVRIPGDEVRWKFTSDSSVNGWGWRFWVHAIMPASTLHERGSDRAVLSQPSMMLVMALLHERLWPHQPNILLRLAAALSACAQLNCLCTAQRIWALKKLHALLLTKYAPKPLHASLNTILSPLIPELQRQYEYEEPQVRGGIHLMHSEYFKTLAALACDMQLDSVLPPADVHKWTWFRRYCIAVRVSQALINRTELPKAFCMEVRKKMFDMVPQNLTTPTNFNTSSFNTYSITSYTSLQSNLSSAPSSVSYASSSSHNSMGNIIEQLKTLTENHQVFKAAHDCQLLQWLNRRPDDWAMTWGGASTIYGWGHNHRGQLGGLEGSRITVPTPCEALSLLRPLQLAGGEQTLFAVTPDGKLFATGYGSGGRLGVGGTDSWAIPTLVSSLQHVFIKKVAVNSGGKHCLALTTEGDVYSWGEGEDGKLGHGNRMSYDRPKLIEDLTGIGIIEIACGSAHSAAITASGLVLTWGKGRYGRLGHGDSEDQLRPKLVEALQGYRAVDIACGSGDAQTLCITDDDNVWSWGDGDYGKLGRGGSDGCKVPLKIESLAGLGVIKVECGSQFSVALTKSGAVYTWGKGDFHRLGHGSADHIRRPKRVAALQGRKVISIATGSLHCVACTDTGEVYTWGDNDEGQLGDGTVTAIQRPRIVVSLQSKHVVKVTCGSAHTLALSTTQMSDRSRPPPNPPLEYDLVRDLPPNALHARLVLLHHFSELMCPSLTMLPITGDLSLSALKDVLIYSIKEAAFRKVIQTTMVRDKQHGPVIELNRIQVKRSRNKSNNGLAGVDGMKSVFGQMVQKLPLLTQEALSLPHRVWKVKFVGESVDDCGGGYSESIAEMCDELQNGSVPLLIPTPNGRGEAGANRDCFLLDPTLTSVLQMNMFRFLGVLMGIAVRTGSPLSLNLAEPVWRQLAGEELRPCDLTEVDRDYVTGLLCIRNMDDDPKIFSTLELPFSTSSAKGHEVPLSTRYTRITMQNRLEYVRLALNFRLHEFDEQVKAVRDGMSKVVPVPLLSLFSASELQAMVCGSPDIPLGLLKSVATYKGFEQSSALVTWFWEVMEEFSNQERSLFLRFVWGRTRLPRTIADFRGRDFVLQVLEKNPPDHFLPESYTCFFLLKMPRYSCKAILLEKLKYAIHFCKSIDTDEYARVVMGDLTEATGSEDNSDIESTQDV